MSEEDKKEIITYIKLIDARHRAGEKVCIECYVKRILNILNRYP